MIHYLSSARTVSSEQLQGFFVGWPNPPSAATHLRILEGSPYCLLALDDTSDTVIGFITAISDGVLSAYIPLLEVLPRAQGRGIGGELVRRMLEMLGEFYMVDLLCDESIQPFYEKFKLQRGRGMMLRNYEHQSGRAPRDKKTAGDE